jgi:ADP-ribose pyrophosphatase
MPLPPLHRIGLIEVEDLTPPAPPGFLQLRRQRLRARYEDGTESEPFAFDSVERTALDAVVVAPYFRDDSGQIVIYLRSSLRPACAQRPLASRPLPEKDTLGTMWELPAGLLEPEECGAAGLAACGARELEEELGFDIAAEHFFPLGHATFPSGGVIGERHHFFRVAVSPHQRGKPSEDGSVLEQRAQIATLTLHEALALCRSGDLEDGKTEIALRRLAEVSDEL